MIGRSVQPQTVILVLAVWLVLSLAVQLPVLIRHSRSRDDWAVVAFRAALGFLGLCVALRYALELSPWLIVAGWVVLDLASTLNAQFILTRGPRPPDR